MKTLDKMHNNMDESENNAKISDSAYSLTGSNSQSRSHSSKWTNSGSNSSGSSGYGGKPSTYSKSELPQPPDKRSKDKDSKKLQSTQMVEVLPPQTPVESENRSESTSKETSNEDTVNAGSAPPLSHAQSTDISKELVATETTEPVDENGFSCVISMHDGVVIYTTSSVTVSLGFPKNMWIGRSFIDFVHPNDRLTFASQITTGLAVPKKVNGTLPTAPTLDSSVSTMVCRIRQYRGLATGFSVKERKVTYTPFLLKLSFKNITDEEGKVIYLVIQATRFVSAFKVPNEQIADAVPFVIRHDANGNLEYIDPESVPYLGYLPQDICEKDALQFYHPEDLVYLCQVYKTIVKEGSLECSKPFRMLAQNGDYLKVETEWTSFINPWSRKLEFIIGKHHLLEGPTNPDVFQPPAPEKHGKVSPLEKAKIQNLRDTIIRIMNQVLTKPAELVKDQMSKRCQDLASFMENLIENQPQQEELRLDVNDTDQSYFERDSVMLGGISPHHEYNEDSKSSTGTPLNYNRLNYNENLQRYFDSHQPYSFEDHNSLSPDENHPETTLLKRGPRTCLSPIAQFSGDSDHMSSIGDTSGMTGRNSPGPSNEHYQPMRLTEYLLCKHNTEMEKELVKSHKETRSGSKADRVKDSNDSKNKKKEHLARYLNRIQPSAARPESPKVVFQPHGLKRASKANLLDAEMHNKHHCPSPRQRRRHPECTVVPASSTTLVGDTHWSQAPVDGVNTLFFGVGIPQQMPVMNQIPSTVPGVFPLYYAPSSNPMNTMMSASASVGAPHAMYHDLQHFNNMNHQSVQCMLYDQNVYGSPYMYSPMTQHMSYCLQDNLMAQTVQSSNGFVNPNHNHNLNRLREPKAGMSNMQSKAGCLWRDKKRTKSSKIMEENADSSNSSNNTTMNQSVIMGTNTTSSNSKSKNRHGSGEKTDGESSYSSFYSSFFKTDSGSGGESDKKPEEQNRAIIAATTRRPKYNVCLSSELIYQYQVRTKNLDDVLRADREILSNLEQPLLVNEQLSQLYLDLQLEGVAAKLTLEEGFTSSSSSGEETCSKHEKIQRRKRVYSKLAFIHEEDMPFPPSPSDKEPTPEPASTEC